MRREREGKIRDNREKEKTWRKDQSNVLCVCMFVSLLFCLCYVSLICMCIDSRVL